MDEIKFRVKGSAAEPYHVTFSRAGGELRAYCTCPAGENGQYCKHRLRILAGNSSEIVTANAEQVRQVQNWLAGTRLQIALSEVAEAERQAESAKRHLAAAKKRLAKLMHRP